MCVVVKLKELSQQVDTLATLQVEALAQQRGSEMIVLLHALKLFLIVVCTSAMFVFAGHLFGGVGAVVFAVFCFCLLFALMANSLGLIKKD